ncbi:MAG TPA: hypothetical protein VFV02_03725 [Acidimicrobiales bacterium]|nr:hypothetical protein [Acidimicrobiales bacterium]
MDCEWLVVRGWRYEVGDLELTCANAFKLAVEQRAFGSQRLVVAGADRDCRFLGLVHCPITDQPELALEYCIGALESDGLAAAVAYSDEPIRLGVGSSDLAVRFFRRRAAAADHGVHLVDWMFCDTKYVLSLKYRLIENARWWDLP